MSNKARAAAAERGRAECGASKKGGDTTVLLHSTTIDADTLRRLVAAARLTSQTTWSQIDRQAAEDSEPIQRFRPRHGQVEVNVEVLAYLAEAAGNAADAVEAAETQRAKEVRRDLRAVQEECDHAR